MGHNELVGHHHNNQNSPKFRKRSSGSISSIILDEKPENVSDYARLSVALIYNFVRDFIWGMLSFTQIDFKFERTSDLYIQLLVDLAYTIPFFFTIYILLRIYYR